MIAAPTTAECMRYGGGWGTCVARPAPPPAWDATATQASLSLWIKASQWAFAATFGGVQVVNEWDDIPSNGDSYFEPIGGSAAIGPQWIPDDGTGKPCVRFRGNSGEGLRLVVGDVAPNLRIAANDDTFHVADRVLTLAMVAKVPLGGTNGAAIAGYYSPTQGAANIGVLQGYGWHTHPTDAYANPPVFTAYPGAGAADHFIASAPTALRGGTRVLYVGDVVFHRYDTGGGVYDINISLEHTESPGVSGGVSSGSYNPWASDSGKKGGIVYPASGGNFFLGGPGRTNALFATVDLYEVWLWDGALTDTEMGLLISYVAHTYP